MQTVLPCAIMTTERCIVQEVLTHIVDVRCQVTAPILGLPIAQLFVMSNVTTAKVRLCARVDMMKIFAIWDPIVWHQLWTSGTTLAMLPAHPSAMLPTEKFSAQEGLIHTAVARCQVIVLILGRLSALLFVIQPVITTMVKCIATMDLMKKVARWEAIVPQHVEPSMLLLLRDPVLRRIQFTKESP